jgi:hypothetical protein
MVSRPSGVPGDDENPVDFHTELVAILAHPTCADKPAFAEMGMPGERVS